MKHSYFVTHFCLQFDCFNNQFQPCLIWHCGIFQICLRIAIFAKYIGGYNALSNPRCPPPYRTTMRMTRWFQIRFLSYLRCLHLIPAKSLKAALVYGCYVHSLYSYFQNKSKNLPLTRKQFTINVICSIGFKSRLNKAKPAVSKCVILKFHFSGKSTVLLLKARKRSRYEVIRVSNERQWTQIKLRVLPCLEMCHV